MNLDQRFWEIDTLRGVAIILMVAYHFLFDLYYFGIFSVNLNSPGVWIFARSTAFIFILVVGISLTLSHSRARIRNKDDSNIFMFKKYFKRGFKLFALGLLITLATWLFIPGDFIVFGVLHFIGVAIILEYFFLDKKYLNLILGGVFIVLGLYITQFNFPGPWLLWLGLKPLEFTTVDYFPLLPWLGVVSLGLFLGNTLYTNYKRQFPWPELSQNAVIKLTSFLGRHSLLIYLIHQPILIIALYLAGLVDLSRLF
ncbi:MAG TPA: heparan-alpha-glucosaminide N-acetyltransferase [Methanobacteriaceae archaeon]|nr:heparan-alpha-glucosaminide N-acetyltransferase [Methanobacteriaceae archaeon]